MDNITCRINNPVSERVSKEGDIIILPGEDGQLGVMYGHMPLAVELKNGKIQVMKNHKIVEELNITRSIAYIKKDLIEILEVI